MSEEKEPQRVPWWEGFQTGIPSSNEKKPYDVIIFEECFQKYLDNMEHIRPCQFQDTPILPDILVPRYDIMNMPTRRKHRGRWVRFPEDGGPTPWPRRFPW